MTSCEALGYQYPRHQELSFEFSCEEMNASECFGRHGAVALPRGWDVIAMNYAESEIA
jgi:hypothetical protein